MFVYYLLFSSNVNSIVYTLIGCTYIFGYLVNKLEIRWVYLSPIKKMPKEYSGHTCGYY